MNKQPSDGVSVISEISVYEGGSGGLHFAAALGWGTLAGTLSLMVSMALAALSAPQNPWMIASILGVFPVFAIVVGLFTLAGLVAIGLPVTLMLWITRSENQFLYAALGAFAGFTAMLLLFVQGSRVEFEEFLFAATGGLAGGASAWRWGGWREALAISRQSNPIPNHQPED